MPRARGINVLHCVLDTGVILLWCFCVEKYHEEQDRDIVRADPDYR